MKTHKGQRQPLFPIFTALVLLATISFSAKSTAAQSCEKLAELKLANTTITAAHTVDAGAFKPAAGAQAPYKELPAFCQVTGVIKPTSDSDIKFEVWMPTSNWNG